MVIQNEVQKFDASGLHYFFVCIFSLISDTPSKIFVMLSKQRDDKQYENDKPIDEYEESIDYFYSR